jgi:hypothetical protein
MLGRLARRLTDVPVVWLAAIVFVVALAFRLGFTLRVPPLVTPDSQGYFLPGWELANGYGFSPELRRTPGYPLFVAAVVSLLGDDLRGLMLAQHVLGALTAGCAVLLGSLDYGRVAGVEAGLLVAFSGPLLVYEHFVMSEALFGLMLTVAVTAIIAALRVPSRTRLVVAGVLLAVAALTRPIAEALVPLVPLAFLLRTRRLTPAARQVGWLALGVAVLMLPWMGRNLVTHGSFAAEGALGQALIGRTVRHDQGFSYREPEGATNSNEAYARFIIRDMVAAAAPEVPSGGGFAQRVHDELRLTDAQTSNLLRTVALKEIARQPLYYIRGSFKIAGDLLLGQPERLLGQWRQRTTRNWDRKWDARIAPLVDKETQPEGPEYTAADDAVAFFQPFRWARQLGVLLLLGSVGALVVRRWRVGLFVIAGAALLLLGAAFLDGFVARYRYPVDPMLAVVAGGGIQLVLLGLVTVASRLGWRAPWAEPRGNAPTEQRDERLPGRQPATEPS